MATTGTKTFSTKGKATPKPTFELAPDGEYECKLLTSGVEIRTSQTSSLPYLTYRLELLNTSKVEGGKNKLVFENLYPWLEPGKDGTAMTDRASQLLGLCRAIGVDFSGGRIISMVSTKDGMEKEVEVLDPQQVAKFLKAYDGALLRAYVKVQKGTGNYSDKNVVRNFIEAEEASAGLEEPEEAEDEEVEEAGNGQDEEVEELRPRKASGTTRGQAVRQGKRH